MTRVDFYVLAGRNVNERLGFACRIAEQAVTEENRVYMHASSETEAEQLDELLWTFRDASFVPHALAGAAALADDDERPPVLIGHRQAQGEMGTLPKGPERQSHPTSLLINLSEDVPPFFDRFARIAELVDADEECRRLGRVRFRFYRDRGCALETHRL